MRSSTLRGEVRAPLRSEVRAKMRPPSLTRTTTDIRQPRGDQRRLTAGRRLIQIYEQLADEGQHLLGVLLNGRPPRQWQHYPQDDAVDAGNAYQWFYHCHAPGDRPGAAEHGHFHLFARRDSWRRHAQSARERRFLALSGAAVSPAKTRHLLAVGIDAKGVPVTLFTVDSAVTGDAMLSAAATESLLARLALDTGNPRIDAVLPSVMALCREEIATLLAARDAALHGRQAGQLSSTAGREILSTIAIDLDGKLAGC